MKTWEIKAGTRTVAVKALKAEAAQVNRYIQKVCGLAHYCIETSGIIGVDEHSSEYWTPLTTQEPGAGYAEARQAFIDGLPDPITAADMPRIIAEAKALAATYMPRVDSRITPEASAERANKGAAIAAASKAKADAWLTEFGQLTKLPRPEGQMAITLEQCFDNSDLMSDYFDAHATIGEPLLLAFVPKQAERESLARRILAYYPTLAMLEWEWHTEKWSMGHGNYLQSEIAGHSAYRNAYNSGSTDGVAYHWEIRFNGYNKELYPYSLYPGVTPAKPADTSTALALDATTTFSDKPTVTHDRDWTWVQFLAKPPATTLEQLKAAGGRFSGKRQAWYFTRHVEAAELGL